jgi:hypothetical protein
VSFIISKGGCRIKGFFQNTGLIITGLITTGIVLLNYGLPGITVPLPFYTFYQGFSFSLVIIIIIINLFILKAKIKKWKKLSLELLAFFLIMIINFLVIEFLHWLDDYDEFISLGPGIGIIMITAVTVLFFIWKKRNKRVR